MNKLKNESLLEQGLGLFCFEYLQLLDCSNLNTASTQEIKSKRHSEIGSVFLSNFGNLPKQNVRILNRLYTNLVDKIGYSWPNIPCF